MSNKHLTVALIERCIRYLIMLLSVVAGVDTFIHKDWVTLASAGLTIVFLLMPGLIEKWGRFRLPVSFRVVYLLYVIGSMYLGEIHSFFYRIVWWDIMLHTWSAMMLTYIGLLLTRVLNRKANAGVELTPFFTVLFAFSFTVAGGAIWELFEFAADKVFGVNMIKAIDPADPTRFYDLGRGFLNSLHDLVMDTTGALIVSVGAYIHLRRGGKISIDI